MSDNSSRRGARPLVAPLVVIAAVGLAGCTSSSTPDRRPPVAARSTAVPAPSVDPAARAAIRQAVSATVEVHSYSFDARTIVQAKRAVRSTVTGRVVRGNGISYRLTTGDKRTQVVRIHRGTYVRKVPGRWSRLAHPRQAIDPSRTLLAVLRGVTPTDVRAKGRGRVVRGALAAAAAARAGLPHDRGLAQVVVRLDRSSRVVGLVVRTHAAAGTTTVGVVVRSSYGRFDRGHPIHPPA